MLTKIIPAWVCLLSVVSSGLAASPPARSVPSFATGAKVGEVSSDGALVWARLSAVRQANPRSTTSAAPGAAGKVRIRYWPAGKEDQAVQQKMVPVDAARDYTCQIPLKGLLPQTTYQAVLTAFGVDDSEGPGVGLRFKTAPRQDQVAEVTAVVVTCQGHETVDDPVRGHWVYRQMLTHDPDFFIHTGDVVYYDKGKAQPLSKTVTAARQRWNRMFSYTWNRAFPMQVSCYFMKDDHDTLKNDCWPGQTYGEITWQEGLALFAEQTPQGPLPYRRRRWGKDLEFWLIEGRDDRSPNPAPDGPQKTILGTAQKAWLKKTLAESDATFKLVVFPSPVVGPDKKGKSDNHANPAFRHEGSELRRFLGGMPNTYVVCGDRHWQYASRDPDTGLVEICCGPINDAHAERGGNPAQNPQYHLYYGGGRGGYLRISVARDPGGTPQIRFLWHADQAAGGAVNHQLTFSAEP
ncbi:MAG: alkaline phosphatase [Planctomycetales bacterium]|nr:alkaline phosphatase [Planctomycetales bacterium]NIP67996.1 alkaline phosphatase [Planctomycetales bacterium]